MTNAWNEFSAELQVISKLVSHFSDARWAQYQVSGEVHDMPSLRNLSEDIKGVLGKAFLPVSVGRLRGIISYMVHRRSGDRVMTNFGVVPMKHAEQHGWGIPTVMRLNVAGKAAVERILKNGAKYNVGRTGVTAIKPKKESGAKVRKAA